MENLPVWDENNWSRLPVIGGEHEADLCVVGLGGSGLSCIEESLSLGRSVIGIDAGEVGGGAAGRNGGFLLAGSAAFYHRTVARIGRERARAIYIATQKEIDRMVAEYPGIVRRTGSLRIAASAEEVADCRLQMKTMIEDGLEVSWYEGPEGEGLLIPGDGLFQPLARCRVLAQRVIARGARLFEGSRATGLTGNLVTTPGGRIHCRSVVVAIDGRLEELLPELGGRVRTARLQMLATAPAPEVSFPRGVYRRWGYEYWQQLPDGRIALGGYRDLGGENEWTSEASPSPTIQEALERFLREKIGVTAPVTHRWAASVGYTESGLPIDEEVRPGLWAIGGYNGTGNIVGAIHGRRAARRVA